MKKETYKAQQPFAGEKKPSMLRRCVGHDYTSRQIYMITMVTERRRPLFGQVVGKSDAPAGSDDAPRIELSPLGQRVNDEWWAASQHHPEVRVLALQMMPDHLHGILFVQEQMEKPLGMLLRGFKQSCNRHYRELELGIAPPVPFVALSTQQTKHKQDRRNEGIPLIYLQENGFTDLAKPGGKRMEACARGQLLILAPWEHHNEQLTISRSQCLKLNDIARLLTVEP